MLPADKSALFDNTRYMDMYKDNRHQTMQKYLASLYGH